jgi:hypothetical protein
MCIGHHDGADTHPRAAQLGGSPDASLVSGSFVKRRMGAVSAHLKGVWVHGNAGER